MFNFPSSFRLYSGKQLFDVEDKKYYMYNNILEESRYHSYLEFLYDFESQLLH